MEGGMIDAGVRTDDVVGWMYGAWSGVEGRR
jgi:hypothetical protein